MFSDSQAIAVLGIAITLESYVYLFANALNGMFLPKVSRMMVGNDTSGILELMIKVGRIQIYIIGFILLWLIAFGNHFINVWLDESYSLVYWCLLFIVIPSFIHLPQEIGLTYTIAANKVKQQSYIYILMGIVNLLLAIPLTKSFGCLGLCFAIFVAYLFRTICLDILFKRELHLNIGRFFMKSYIKLLSPLAIVLIISFGINLIPIKGWLGLIVKSILFSVCFCAVMYTIGLNQYEKELFLTPIKKIIKK